MMQTMSVVFGYGDLLVLERRILPDHTVMCILKPKISGSMDIPDKKQSSLMTSTNKVLVWDTISRFGLTNGPVLEKLKVEP